MSIRSDDRREPTPTSARGLRARIVRVLGLTTAVLVVTGGPLLPTTAAGPAGTSSVSADTGVLAAGPVMLPARRAAAPLAITAGEELALRPAPRRLDNRTTYRSFSALASPPKVPLATWAVADLDTGEILAAHRSRTRRQPASTIKLLSALTAAKRIDASARHRVTRDEANPVSCVCVGLLPGRRYDRGTLMSGMLLVSGNDAAEALAGADPGGRDGFLRGMNRLADELGAHDTRAVNPSGLTLTGAASTARDLLVLLRAAQASPTVAPVLSSRRSEFGPVSGPARTILRANPYAETHRRSEGKTGYTRAAGFNLVVATTVRDGDGRLRRIGAAAMGAPSRSESDRAVERLTRWVAAHYAELEAVGSLPEVPVAALD